MIPYLMYTFITVKCVIILIVRTDCQNNISTVNIPNLQYHMIVHVH